MLEIIFEFLPYVFWYVTLTFAKWVLTKVLRIKKKKNPQDKDIPKLEKKLQKLTAKLEKLNKED